MTAYSGTCGDNLTWSLETTSMTLTIQGTGAMSDFSSGGSPWDEHGEYIARVIFKEGVTSIGKYAFFNNNNGTYPHLTSIKFSDTIETIEIMAFSGSSGITELILPASLTTIHARAFDSCSGLVSIAFKGVKPSMPSSKIGGGTYYRQFYDVGNATVYSSGWASDSVFPTTIRGGATFTYKPLSELPPEYSIIPVNAKGIWRKSIPHAKVGGVWKKTVAWCKVNGVWKRIGSGFEGYTGLAVFFNANGGEGDMSPILTESSATIPSNAFTRDKYRFSGWNTSPDGSGTTYSAGQTITITDNVTLYAIWIAVHTVTFDANGGSGSIAAIQTEGALTIPSNTFTLSGYAFNGWNTSPDGTGTAYSEGQTTTVTSDLTLYAVWIRQYTVSFSANGGTGSINSIVTTSSATIPANAFTRSGYRFDRWNTAADGSGTSYSAEQSISVTSDITLYAIWVQQFTVRWWKLYNCAYTSLYPPASNSGPIHGDSNYYYLNVQLGGSTIPYLSDNFTVNNSTSPVRSTVVDAGTSLYVVLRNKTGSDGSAIYLNGTKVQGSGTAASYTLSNGIRSNIDIQLKWTVSGVAGWGGKSYWECYISEV